MGFNGLGLHLGNLARVSDAETRSISAENFSGAKGQGGMAEDGTGAVAGRELGRGWKLSPSIHIAGRSKELTRFIRVVRVRCGASFGIFRVHGRQFR